MKNIPLESDLTYLSEGRYTFTLRHISDRAKELPQPNFKDTGKALMAIRVKDANQTVERLKTPENASKHKGRYSETKPCHKWGKEDLSMVDTTVLI